MNETFMQSVITCYFQHIDVLYLNLLTLMIHFNVIYVTFSTIPNEINDILLNSFN